MALDRKTRSVIDDAKAARIAARQEYFKPQVEAPVRGMTKEEVRTAVKQRDGDWCLLCGQPGPGLHLHRIRYGSEGGRYEVANCVLLCHAHHNPVVHDDKATWQPLLFAYIQRDDFAADRLRSELARHDARQRPLSMGSLCPCGSAGGVHRVGSNFFCSDCVEERFA